MKRNNSITMNQHDERARIENLEDENRHLRLQMADLNQELSIAKKRIVNLKQTTFLLEEENKLYEDRLSIMQGRVDFLQRQLNALRPETGRHASDMISQLI